MNGRTFIAGLAGVAAIAAGLVLTTTSLRADPAPEVDEVAALKQRVTALEAEVRSLRAELNARPDPAPMFDFKNMPKFDGEAKVKVNINGKEYELPRDKEKLKQDMPNMKFGEGMPKMFKFESDGNGFKFELPEEFREEMRKMREQFRQERKESKPQATPTSI